MKNISYKFQVLLSSLFFLIGALILSKKSVKEIISHVDKPALKDSTSHELEILTHLLKNADTDAFQEKYRQLVASSFER